jgi:hypothetical protein
MRKTRLRLMVAYLLVSGGALIAAPASSDKRHRDPVSKLEILHVFSGFHDFTGQLMPGNMRENDISIMPLPPMPIAQAHARGFDFDNHTMALGDWGRHILKLHDPFELFVYDCFHFFPLGSHSTYTEE